MKFDVLMTDGEALREAGHRLAQIRLGRNMTQAELASRSGVSKRSIERLETGFGGLRLDVFFRVCGALGLTQGFETLLPESRLSPQDILAAHTTPKRARSRKAKDKSKWGIEQ
jgi:transcriptional regulator with XRE-family HTH domain